MGQIKNCFIESNSLTIPTAKILPWWIMSWSRRRAVVLIQMNLVNVQSVPVECMVSSENSRILWKSIYFRLHYKWTQCICVSVGPCQPDVINLTFIHNPQWFCDWLRVCELILGTYECCWGCCWWWFDSTDDDDDYCSQFGWDGK